MTVEAAQTAQPGEGLVDVDVTTLAPERFADVLSAQSLERFEHTITRGRELMDGRTLWTVNSTALGGGVAEMLRSLLGYVRGAGIDARWVVIGGDADFFRITKRLHNRLHGADVGGALGERERAVTSVIAPHRPSCWRSGCVPTTWCSSTIRRPRG